MAQFLCKCGLYHEHKAYIYVGVFCNLIYGHFFKGNEEKTSIHNHWQKTEVSTPSSMAGSRSFCKTQVLFNCRSSVYMTLKLITSPNKWIWCIPEERWINWCRAVNKLKWTTYITSYICYSNKWTSISHQILNLLIAQQRRKPFLPIHAIN